MIRPSMVWGVARAEARLSRRLVRYWVFQVLATGIGFLFLLQYWFIHHQFSSWSASASMINPRYLFGVVGVYYLVVFLVGLVFLGYDVRARDARERMAEVLDTVPCSNLELLLGRYVGILLAGWVPVLVIALALWGLSAVLGQAFEWRTLVSWTVFMAIPAYCFMLGLTFVATLLLRNRLLAAVAVIGILIGIVVINFGFVPIYLLPLVDITGGFSLPFGSDLIPRIADARGLLQRTSVLVAGIAFFLFAVAIHPRRDDSKRSVTALSGALLLILAAAGCGFLVWETVDLLDRKADWKARHVARSAEPAPDLLELSGDVRLRPGRDLAMDLDLRMTAPRGETLDSALFTLNPGLEVKSVHGADGTALAFTHGEDGLLDVELPRPLEHGDETVVSMAIEGQPDLFFAYLDAAFDPLEMSIRDGNVMMLGFYPYLNDPRFVALMPGVQWLPSTGTAVEGEDGSPRTTDFFRTRLDVEVPDGWLVAGPGRREPIEGAERGRTRFRFAPTAPMPRVALIAAPFESRSEEIDGVEIEALIHPDHVSNIDFFADAAVEIRDWTRDKLEEAAEVGLDYPYDALTFVEIPTNLRGYGGGWRMDSTLIQPAMVLVRESSFPTANFATRFNDPDRYRDQEGGVPRAKRRVLERFFENDFSGGNPFVAASRSFFGFETAGEGSLGLPLDFVCENLTTELVTDKTGYFSVHMMGGDMNDAIRRLIPAAIRNSGSDDMTSAMIQAVASTNDVWDEILGVSLVDMDPRKDPKRTVDVLTLKGGAMARSMLDDLGREKTGNLLADLRERTAGETYDREDVVAVGQEVGADLGRWLDVWLYETELPGFVVGDASLERLTDATDGSPQYQLLVTVRNDEAPAGLVRLDYRSGGPREDRQSGKSDPIRIPGHAAMQIGLVLGSAPSGVQVAPYLALNREPFSVQLPAVDEEKISDAEPFTGAREVPWVPPHPDAIIVDDLDEGFSVEETETRSMFRLGGRGGDETLDAGLPVAEFGPRSATKWSRWSTGRSYGRYRHTTAVIRKGSGENKATFLAEIPKAGSWELNYYLPQGRDPEARRRSHPGTWSLTVSDGTDTRDVSFDADDGESGWNSLGTFELPGGEVRVTVTDATDGDFVLADAIRWTPAL